MPSVSFKMTLPVKPSATATSTAPHGQLPGLHIAGKPDGRRFHLGEGRNLELAALGFLGADVHKPHLGGLDLHDLFHIQAAHHPELGENLGAAFHVGPAVHQQVAAGFRGNDAGQRRPLNALHPL